MSEKEIDKLFSGAKHFHRNQEYERELEVWRKVCRIKPANPFFKHNVALALMNSGKYDEAIELFDYLAKKYPGLSRVHNNRANLLMRMGVELQYLTPLFMQALNTSEDVNEFTIHFHNVCGSIVYGVDEGGDEALDTIEEMLPDLLDNISPPDLRQRNKSYISGIMSGYRNMAAYRKSLIQRRWRCIVRGCWEFC